MNLSVVGLGMASKVGGTEDLEQLLTGRLINPNDLSSSRAVSVDIPADSGLPQQLLRRMGHFAKISVLSACRAIGDSGLEIRDRSVGIIQGSVYGPISAGIQSFDDLIDFGDNQLSPTNFSGSVFNTAATYLSLAYGIQGPTLTHTSGLDTLFNSLLTASLWLDDGIDYVILGVGDEYTPYFDNYDLAEDATGLLPTGEGWTTFVLSREDQAKYGKIRYGSLTAPPETKNRPTIYSIWHERIRDAILVNHAQANRACFPVWLRGSYPSAAAFDLGLALICAKNRRFPSDPAAGGNYQLQDLKDDEIVCCYNPLENHGLAYYEILTD